jgi:glycine C-acetyltransferase
MPPASSAPRAGHARAPGRAGRRPLDIITGTLGKALGGASGGFTSGRRAVIELLRQRSRPYLFSNTLAPAIVGASLAVLDLLESSTELRDRVHANTASSATPSARPASTSGPETTRSCRSWCTTPCWRSGCRAPAGAGRVCGGLLLSGGAPGAGRIRVQLSAAHSPQRTCEWPPSPRRPSLQAAAISAEA